MMVQMASKLTAKHAADRAAKTGKPAPRMPLVQGPDAKEVKQKMLEAGWTQDPRNPDSWIPPGT